MHELETHLDRWVAAGLLERDQAEAIVGYEATHPDSAASPQASAAGVPTGTPSPTSPPLSPHAGSSGPQVAGAEAVGYVGAALVVGALGRIIFEIWPQLAGWGRLTLAALVTVLAFGTGLALAPTSRAALQRLASVLFTVGVLTAAWLGALVASELLTVRWDVQEAIATGAGFAAAVPVYLLRRRALAQATVLVATVAFVVTLLRLPAIEPSTGVVGLVLWAIGAAWLLAGHGGWLPPRRLAGVLGGLLALLGAQIGSFGDERVLGLLGALVTAGALVALALRSDTLHHLVVGALGLFIVMPQLVFELFGDAIGAPAALLVVGLLLLLGAVGLGRAGQKVRREHRDDPDPSPRPGDTDPGSPPQTGGEAS